MFETSGDLVVAELDDDGAELHQVTEPFWLQTGITDWAFELFDALSKCVVRQESAGRLWLLPGFIFDGSSGPTADKPNLDNVPAGFHDAWYRGFRTRKVPTTLRKRVDGIYAKLCELRGMSKWFHPVSPDAWWKVWQWPRLLNPGYRTRYLGLRAFGGIKAAVPLRGPEYPKRKAA